MGMNLVFYGLLFFIGKLRIYFRVGNLKEIENKNFGMIFSNEMKNWEFG